jgi:predicted dehydrogenase
LYGVVTRDPAKGRAWSERVWTTLEAALADDAIDAVYIATPVALHGPQSIASLEAGKHVLCEKPMAMCYAEACSMQRAAEQAGRTLGVAYYRRMYPKLLRARALLAEGVIGTPVLAEINCHGWFAAENGHRAWLLDPALAGGGPLYDIASHRIDVLNFLFGTPVRASGHLSNTVHHYAVEDSATLLIDYQSGVRGVVDVRWHSRVDRDEFRIIGTDGEMRLSPLNGPLLAWPGGEEQLAPHSNLHYPCIANFVDSLEGTAALASSGASAQWTDWVTEQVARR